MRHPVPARLKAYVFHRIDFNREVEQHLLLCKSCAETVANLLLERKKEERVAREG